MSDAPSTPADPTALREALARPSGEATAAAWTAYQRTGELSEALAAGMAIDHATLLDRLAKAEGEHEAGLQHRNDMYDRIVSLRIDVGAATAGAEATAAERDALLAQVARMAEALKIALAFVDRAAGEGLEFPADGDCPRMDAADVCIAAAEALVLDWGDDVFTALVVEGRAALKTQEDEHGQS